MAGMKQERVKSPLNYPSSPSPVGRGRRARKVLNTLITLNPLNIRWDVGGADAFLSDLG